MDLPTKRSWSLREIEFTESFHESKSLPSKPVETKFQKTFSSKGTATLYLSISPPPRPRIWIFKFESLNELLSAQLSSPWVGARTFGTKEMKTPPYRLVRSYSPFLKFIKDYTMGSGHTAIKNWVYEFKTNFGRKRWGTIAIRS